MLESIYLFIQWTINRWKKLPELLRYKSLTLPSLLFHLNSQKIKCNVSHQLCLYVWSMYSNELFEENCQDFREKILQIINLFEVFSRGKNQEKMSESQAVWQLVRVDVQNPPRHLTKLNRATNFTPQEVSSIVICFFCKRWGQNWKIF